MSDLKDLPPILPSLEDELLKYLSQPENLPIHSYDNCQEFWVENANPSNLFDLDESPLCTDLRVQRDPNTGEIIEFREVVINTVNTDPKTSMSLNRKPAPPSDSIRGNASFIPFLPASFSDKPVLNLPDVSNSLPFTKLLTVPPGFDRGIVFDENQDFIKTFDNDCVIGDDNKVKNVIDLLDLTRNDFLSVEVEKTNAKASETNKEQSVPVDDGSLFEELAILSSELPVLNISKVPAPPKLKSTEWAILLDAVKPVEDFEKTVPEMAYKFPFELDNFQKLAIQQLEQHNHVFVAAHTSAGKTVVADYAIALSQKHMTRTIYTSPIKALSNQKYRDFKRVFKDVGLITGDFQINPTAACLIMTTEILRTMLYCGSDIARDLEYAIFDEVHYVNDRDRGHVWEQVLILLPAHVCVVLLSATVPNTVEFADWLGRTHQRKVYVITTDKRPVPLKHYLYTGSGGTSRDHRFMVLSESVWNKVGYNKAVDSLQSKNPKQMPAKLPYLNPKQEKTLWVGLVDHLKRCNLLPVVCFVFSRAKCDENASSLMCLDLTTQKEKSRIHTFFEKCVNSLKEPDRYIPQILRMRMILNNGIGVHHSGILPIIKEIVEMLFQEGLIKLLFATETFAMGVNMPARTVVFDSITKYDGLGRRNLECAEYIQMAGRAGRRNWDEEGTVIILCKNRIPLDYELRTMMTGIPNTLRSQFRITYGMVLSLLRVEILSVEGMMSRSFCEADHQKKLIEVQQQLKHVEAELEECGKEEISSYLQPFVKFYELANAFIEEKEKIWSQVFLSAKVTKAMVQGRVITITQNVHINKLALVLHIAKSETPTYKVLILTDKNNVTENKKNLWYKMLTFTMLDQLFSPANVCDHDVLTISCTDILQITHKTIKVDYDLVLKDWEKRQIERFRSDPPGPNCSKAVQELYMLTTTINGSDNIETHYQHLINDLKINDQTIYSEVHKVYKLYEEVVAYTPNVKTPSFDEQFTAVFERKFLEQEKLRLKHLLSNASLTLYPDYENRITLLKHLRYIDDQNRVQLKGRVACEMGMNELLITELVLRNILANLTPEEVAAVLSALVTAPKRIIYQHIDCADEPNAEINENVSRAVKGMKEIHAEIAQLENQLCIRSDEFQSDLNFELVPVVYEWASAKSFADIMTLTNIQEGIIVRCIQQLNDTICDVKNAARIIGDPELQSKMEEASTAIKRDIVFAASLYTVD